MQVPAFEVEEAELVDGRNAGLAGLGGVIGAEEMSLNGEELEFS